MNIETLFDKVLNLPHYLQSLKNDVQMWINKKMHLGLDWIVSEFKRFRHNLFLGGFADKCASYAVLGLIILVIGSIASIWFFDFAVYFTALGATTVLIGTGLYFFASENEELAVRRYKILRSYVLSVLRIEAKP